MHCFFLSNALMLMAFSLFPPYSHARFVYFPANRNRRTLDTFQIPFEMGDDLAVLICNSNVRHELSHSEYPTRRNQCAQALELMRLNSYKDATIKSLDGKYENINKNRETEREKEFFVFCCRFNANVSQKCATNTI